MAGIEEVSNHDYMGRRGARGAARRAIAAAMIASCLLAHSAYSGQAQDGNHGTHDSTNRAVEGANPFEGSDTAGHDGLPSAPADFELESSGGTRRTLREARGRVVILFYEDREHTRVNYDFKELLHRFIVDNALTGETRTYAIANVTGVVDGVMRDIARTAISAFASQYGIEILVDWERALQASPFSLGDRAANVALIDRSGRVRWRHSGVLSGTERRAFFRMFRRLLRESAN